MSKHPKRHGPATPVATPDPGAPLSGGGQERLREAAEVDRTDAEATREQAEQARAWAEEGRELAEQIRQSAESLRLGFRDGEEAAQHAKHILEAAGRAEAAITQRLETLLNGIREMSTELRQLRVEAAELRQMLSSMQQASREQQIIAGESQLTRRRMDFEGYEDPEAPNS
ncbi:MAG TPA: hypothetical protein VJQ44_13150 [Gemmatimonadales bacterium]|nr:hypothetical protein [Gemmatimonadales bacterium]